MCIRDRRRGARVGRRRGRAWKGGEGARGEEVWHARVIPCPNALPSLVVVFALEEGDTRPRA
eukprot:6355019-Prymnesium_polylepis.1